MRKLITAAVTTVLVATATLVALPSNAGAQTSGTNGNIVFISRSFDNTNAGRDIFVAAPGANTSTAVGLSFRDLDSVDACHTNPNLLVFDGQDELGGQRGLWTVNATPGSSPQFLAGTENGVGPVWNSTCSQIAFERFTGLENGGIFTIPAGGGTANGPLAGTTLNDVPGESGGQAPEWSPDDQRIYFHADIDPSGTDVNQIFSVLATGGDQQQTVASGDGNCGVAGDTTTSCQNVSSRPDNQLVAFEKNDGTNGNPRVHTAQKNQGFPNLLVQSQPIDQRPDWSPDGTDIVVKEAGTGLAILAFDVVGGQRTAFDPGPNGADISPDWAKAVAIGDPTPSPSPVPTPSPTPGGSTGGTGGFGLFPGFGGFGFGGFGSLFGGGGFGGLLFG